MNQRRRKKRKRDKIREREGGKLIVGDPINCFECNHFRVVKRFL